VRRIAYDRGIKRSATINPARLGRYRSSRMRARCGGTAQKSDRNNRDNPLAVTDQVGLRNLIRRS
jgi:hypothetical protein